MTEDDPRLPGLRGLLWTLTTLLAPALSGCAGDFSTCPSQDTTTIDADGGALDADLEDGELDCDAWCGGWDRWEAGDCPECSQACAESPSGNEVICRVSIPCE